AGLAARQRSGDGLLQALGKAPTLHQMAREIERRVGLSIKDHPHPNAVIVQNAPVEIERSITLSHVRRLRTRRPMGTRWGLAQHRERPGASRLMRTPAARLLSSHPIDTLDQGPIGRAAMEPHTEGHGIGVGDPQMPPREGIRASAWPGPALAGIEPDHTGFV